MPEETPGWSGGQRAFGDFAPGLVHYTDQVLFDEVWERAALSKRDRSLATVAALIAGGNIEQLNFHLPFAKQNGVTEEELIETITHLAFYTGWPKAMSAMTVAKNQFQSRAMEATEHDRDPAMSNDDTIIERQKIVPAPHCISGDCLANGVSGLDTPAVGWREGPVMTETVADM